MRIRLSVISSLIWWVHPQAEHSGKFEEDRCVISGQRARINIRCSPTCASNIVQVLKPLPTRMLQLLKLALKYYGHRILVRKILQIQLQLSAPMRHVAPSLEPRSRKLSRGALAYTVRSSGEGGASRYSVVWHCLAWIIIFITSKIAAERRPAQNLILRVRLGILQLSEGWHGTAQQVKRGRRMD